MRALRAMPVIALAAAVLVPSSAGAEVKIELRNGSTITADMCQETDGGLRCSKMGGVFEIDRQDILSVRKSKRSRPAEEEDQPETVPPGEAQGVADDASSKSAEAAAPARGAEARQRLEQITQRKRQLTADRESLLKDREKLQEKIKGAPDWMTTDRFEDLRKRAAALDERVRAFNDEADRLNREEKEIIDSLKGGRAPENP